MTRPKYSTFPRQIAALIVHYIPFSDRSLLVLRFSRLQPLPLIYSLLSNPKYLTQTLSQHPRIVSVSSHHCTIIRTSPNVFKPVIISEVGP